jgi:ribosomal protein L12E/L44/L45/RPP1/RPP2
VDNEQKKVLVKIILTLQSDHHGCKEEAINIAKEALGIEIEHNSIREMINEISEDQIEKFMNLI